VYNLDLKQLPERMVIKKEWLPLALYHEAKLTFAHYEATVKWQKDAEMMAMDIRYVASESFQALYQCVYETLLQGRPATKALLRDAFINYIDSIMYEVQPYLEKESQAEEKSPEEIQEPQEDIQLTFDVIEDAIEQERIFASMNTDYLFMRNTISQKKFVETAKGTYTSEIVDTKGDLRGLAELRKDTIEMPDPEQAELWLNLVESTLNAFDELTADLLDIISHMWLLQYKDEDGYIEFHSDEVLKLRHDGAEDKLIIRERDRFKIMKRVAALSSIWISMRDNNVRVVNKDKISAEDDYDFTTFHRMFDINSVKIAYDKTTGEPKGIYALKIKPAPILRKYFDNSLQTFVSLDLKVIRYSYHNQKELKRLGRYLSYQWKIRTLSRNLKQPFKIKTLIDTLDFPSSYNGVIVREKLEKVLDDLKADGIVDKWYYSEPVDESRVGKRDWVKKYWGELSLIIMPPQETITENRKKIGQMNLVIEAQQNLKKESISEGIHSTTQSKKTVETPRGSLTPQAISEIMELEKLSVRAAAAEIGIAHSTLLRYLNNEMKRYNKNSMTRLAAWYEAHINKTKGESSFE